ncbi:MAG: transglycosylase SLT domain-containing protein [Caldilineaceae bacterium SB0664_bin_27]|uniref:Transglycosylase SLT domain-containing protein n=1 Tax=Caldilineaceae bacterium SB0664_bin_27 TaxID=2605260 RepID=A0A6B0YZH7_9CHLR|nr:transglycosylase SLT domain-containing protein [Caldilineaceae bacterium SB0664_bin_27]
MAPLKQRSEQDNPLISEPNPSCSRRRGPRRLPVSLSILILLALFLSACRDRRAAPASLPPAAATPPPSQSLSQSSSSPAAPASLLDQAADLHRTGDYGREQELLQSLLDGLPTAPAQGPQTPPASRTQQRAEILYRLALSYLAADNPQQALDALEELRRMGDALAAGEITLPAAPAETVAQLLINSLFLRGEALAGVDRHTEAATAYRAFLERRPQLSGVVEERIAAALLALDEREQAAAALRRAAAAAITADEQVRLLERLAAVLEAGGLWREAAAIYDEILAGPDPAAPAFDNVRGYTETPIYRAGYLYRAGMAYAAAGDRQTAVDRWRAAVTDSPASDAAYLSLTQLVNRDAPVDALLRGRINLFAEAWQPAVAAFEEYLAESPQGADAGEAWLGAARARMGLEQWEEAGSALDRVLSGFPDCPCLGEAWLARAQIALEEGEAAEGRRIYRTFAREHPDDPLAAEALWLSALSSLAAETRPAAAPAQDVRTAVDPLDEGVADLLRLADAYPGSPRAADGLAVAGIGAFEGGRYQLAANLFQRLLSEYPGAQPEFATYWLGRARHARGEVTKARAHWHALVARAPETYYGILARLDIDAAHPGRDLIPRMARSDTTAPVLPGDDGSRAFAEAWLSGPDGFPRTQSTGAAAADRPWELPRAVLNDPDLVKGELLLALGRRAEGLQLLEQLFWRYHNDPAALYPLMRRFHDSGANRLSLSAAHRLIEISPAERIAQTPLFIQRFAYPEHYARLVEKQAEEFQFAPALLYGLIYQESRFEPAARSYAGARGLMQILPGTGWEIARTLNYPNYSTELLDYPIVSIRFGTYYLRWARDYVAGNDIAALAGYNAGPRKAKNWLTRTDPDDALFIHNVPYQRTRRYLEGILICYTNYLRLYG